MRVFFPYSSLATAKMTFVLLSLGVLISGCDKIPDLLEKKGAKDQELVITEGAQADIVDEDFCFRIRSLGNQWKMLDHKEIAKVLPDGAAGAVHGRGTWAAVIVEPLDDMAVKDYAELTQINMKNLGMTLSPVKSLQYAGQSAYQYTADGKVDGVSFHYDVIAFLYQDFGYQILTWGATERFSKENANEFFESFSLEEGVVQIRGNSGKVRDFDGVGHRIRDNVFQSVISGMSATSTREWALMIGAELKKSHDSAEFGFKNPKKNMSFVTIPESLNGMTKETYREFVVTTFEEILQEQGSYNKSEQSMPIKIDGKEVVFYHYEVTGNFYMQWYYGIVFHGVRGYQFMCWGLSKDRQEMNDGLRQVCQQIHFIPVDELKSLENELLALPDPEDKVGLKWCLRNGVYRDFEFGFRWKKPKGFWTIHAGDSAVRENVDSRISCHDASINLSLQVLPEEAGNRSLGEFHKLVSRALFRKPVDMQRSKLGGLEAMESVGVVRMQNLNLDYKLLTTLREGIAYQVVIWGMQGALEKQKKQIEEVIAGFEFADRPLASTEKGNSSYTDHRLGYHLGLSGEWTVEESTPPHIRSLGSGVQFSKSNKSVQVLAIKSLEPGQDSSFLLDDLINSSLKANFSSLKNAKPIIKNHQFSGNDWKEYYWSGRLESVSFLSSIRGNTLYLLTIAERFGKARKLVEEVVEEFELLD